MRHIIHFTSKFDSLKKIIASSSIRLFYCKEEFYLGNERISSAAHPMVCFSEFNVKTIDNRHITYGKYGIALSKKWVDKHKIHPVLYIDKNSLIAKSLADLLKARRQNATVQLAPNVRLSIMTIKCFTKNSIGYNSYFDINDFDFKSENEWRYVPTKTQIGNNLISQSRSKYLKKQDYYNDKLLDYPLTFSEGDIEYIFVATEKEKRIVQNLVSLDSKRIKIANWSTELRSRKANAQH